MAEVTSYTPAELNGKMDSFYRSGALAHTKRNGVAMMNPYHFYKTGDVAEHQKLAGRLMDQIYASPPEDHAALTKTLVNDNENAAPYMLWEAFATGHRSIYDALQNFERPAGPAEWEDSINNYRDSRIEEVLAAVDSAVATETDAWLAEFPGEDSQLAFEAAGKGQLAVLQHLLGKGVELHSESDPSLQPLHAACHHGQLEIAQAILDAGVDVNICDDVGGTPLMRAAVAGKAEMVEWLLAKGADPHIRETRDGQYNALEYSGGHFAVVRLLLDHGAPWSPVALAAAASGGDESAFGILVERAGFAISFPLSADQVPNEPQKMDARQREAVLLALEHCAETEKASSGIVQWLLRQCGESSEDGSVALDASDKELMNAVLGAVHTSAGDATADSTSLLLKSIPREATEHLVHEQKRPDADYQGFINSLLLEAVAANSLANAQLLIEEYNADVNKASAESFMTPLFLAARQGHIGMLKLLIDEAKADIQIGSGKYANGPTPLWAAIRNQNEDAARILLHAGGPFDQLHAALESGAKRLFIAAAKQDRYRSPVRMLAWFDPAWDGDDNEERFLCLESPDGFVGELWPRKSDEELKDWRPLQLPPGLASKGWGSGLVNMLQSWNPWS